jgi:hypothetical protein
MAANHLELLTKAIARNAGIVLSLPSAGMLRHHKSRFLAETPGGFWVESAPRDGALIDALVASGRPAGISFKASHLKAVFPAVVLRRDPAYQMNAFTQVQAVLLAMPGDIEVIQRRNNYRVHIPLGAPLSVRTWRIPERAHLADRPMHAQEIACELRDLSVSGMGVTFHGVNGEPPRVSTQDRLRIEFTHGEDTMLFEGRMRHPAAPSRGPTVRAGVQFKALEDDIDGRQILARLARIIGELQREEARRLRTDFSEEN